MSSKHIILIGCGSVGSRHLQAIAKLPYELTIDVVEKIEKTQELGKSRLNEIDFDKNKIQCFWYNDISQLKNTADLVIVSTQAPGKVDLIYKLLELGNTRFFIDKIIAQSKNDYEYLLTQMKLHNAKAWVNTARGYYESYQKIKEFFKDSGPIHMSVNAGNDGLGCTAIHWIHLFSFFCNDYKIKIEKSFLYDQIFPNKRGDNLMEFAGSIIISSCDDSVLTINYALPKNLPFTVMLMGENKQLFIDETNEQLHILKTDKNLNLFFKNELQSSLTTKIAYDIIETDQCLLPTLQDSSYAHYELFSIFLSHVKKILNEDREICPIT